MKQINFANKKPFAKYSSIAGEMEMIKREKKVRRGNSKKRKRFTKKQGRVGRWLEQRRNDVSGAST